MTEQHPINPPPELRSQWYNETPRADIYDYIIEKAAQWGADQELKACARWASEWCSADKVDRLLAARRPKPLSLKQQALEALDRMWNGGSTKTDWELFRRALEALPDD